MSTRSTLIYSDNTGNHIWEETNESVYWFNNFLGYNVYGGIDFLELKDVKLTKYGMLLTFIPGTYFNHLFPEGLELYQDSIIEFEMDAEGVSFGIKATHASFGDKMRELVQKQKALIQ